MLRRLGAVVLVALAATGVWAAERQESTFTRGLAAYRAASYPEAIALFDEVLRQNPDDAAARYYRGLSLARTGRIAEAIPALEKAAKDLPDVPVAADLGVANYQAGRRQEAVRWLETATLNRTGAAGAHLLLGIIAYEDGDLATAQRHLAEADAAGDSRVKGTAAYYLGLVAVKSNRPEDARSSFEQAQAAGEPAVAQAAASYLNAISRPEMPRATGRGTALGPLSLSAHTSFQYDSNVLIADIPLSQRQALPFSHKKNDGRFVLGAGAAYTVLGDEHALLAFSYDFYQSIFFSVDRLDLQGHTLSGIFEYGDGIVVPGIQGSYSVYLTDGTSTYLARAFGTPYVIIQEGDIGQSEAYFAITGDNYLGDPFNPFRDAYNYAVGARQTFFLGSRDRWIDLGYQWDKTDTTSDSAGARDFDERSNQVDVGVGFAIADIAWIEARWMFSNDNYLHGNSRAAPVITIQPDGSVTLTRLQRRDDRNVVSLLVARQLTDNLYASLGYYFTDSGANIPVFEYSRHIVSATVGVNF